MSAILVCPRCGRPRLPGDLSNTCAICFTSLVNVSHLMRMADGNACSGKEKMAVFQRRCAESATRFEQHLALKSVGREVA